MAGEDSTVSGVAGRYARALFELALDAKSVDAVKADIEKFDAMIAESADLNRLVRSPVYGAEERGRALTAVLAKAGIGGLTAKFLMFVTANRRLFSVREMIRDFRKLVAKWKGEVTAQVRAVLDHGVEFFDVGLHRVDGFGIERELEQRARIAASHAGYGRIFACHVGALLKSNPQVRRRPPWRGTNPWISREFSDFGSRRQPREKRGVP